jgi:hypothetical protein
VPLSQRMRLRWLLQTTHMKTQPVRCKQSIQLS